MSNKENQKLSTQYFIEIDGKQVPVTEEFHRAYIYKPQGKPTLVPASDKRMAINTAKNDFKEEN